MKITFYQSILFALILFQAVTTVQPQLLNNVSHVIDNITEQNPPPTTEHASNSDNKPNTPSAPAPPPPSSSSSQAASPPPAAHSSSAPAATTPQPTTTTQQPPSSQPPAPAPPPPTHSSTDKPTTSQKPSDTTTQPPPETNENKPTPPTPNNTPTNNDKDKDRGSTPAPPTTSSSSSGASSKAPKAPGSKLTPTGQDDTSTTDDSVPSITNGVNRSTAPSNNSSSGNKTGTIVGAVVGSIFGVALIGGVLTWVNRHGGCASRRSGNKRSSDFEDYGLADTDFPHNHHQSPQPMQSIGLATNAAAIGSATPVLGATSPTIPRLNDQGTYYGNVAEDPYAAQHQYVPAYQPQMDANGSNAVAGDYNNGGQPIMDYNAAQQPYYYQQENVSAVAAGGAVGGYYDESGYYYDGGSSQQQQLASPNPATGGYDMAAQYNSNQNQAYSGGGDPRYYKPDQRI